MGLNGRKEKILQAVVDGYIETCQPVSSAEIKEKHLPSLSSATIRNEMASLEEMGYLAQLHTSSGRVPTAEAYRLYVEKLMPKRKLTRSELKIIKRYFNKKITELDDVLKSTAKVLSEITNLTSVAYVQNLDDATILNIRIVRITDTSALIIIVTTLGVLKDTTVHIGEGVTDEYCNQVSDFVTSVFAGHRISEINSKPAAIIKTVRKEYERIFDTIVRILKSYSHDETFSDIVLEGSAKILEQPEYANLQKAKAMLEFLDAKEELVPVLQNSDDMNINFKIGKDNEIKDGMPECAIVTASYNIGGTVGNAGVIGPIRMDYSKVVSVLDYLSKTVQMLPAGESSQNACTEDDNSRSDRDGDAD